MDLSTTVYFQNNTPFSFNLSQKNINFGSWDKYPPGIIPADSAYRDCKFKLKDTTGAASGSEGSVTYRFGDSVFKLSFCDSYGLNGNYVTLDYNAGKIGKRYGIVMDYYTSVVTDWDWVKNKCSKSKHPLYVLIVINAKFPVKLDTNPKLYEVFKKKFPNVSSPSNVIVIGDNDPQYNCIAWSLGINYAFITIGLSKLSQFIKTYETAADSDHGGIWKAKFNYIKCNKLHDFTVVDGMGTGTGKTGFEGDKMEHANRYFTDAYFVYGVWTAKMGAGHLLSFKRNDLQGGMYGNWLISLKRNISSNQFDDFLKFYKNRHYSIMNIPLDETKLDLLENKIKKNKYLKEFETKFDLWKEEINQEYIFSSNIYDYRNGIKYKSLLDMGDVILPLVANKMSKLESFFVIVLYEDLQINKQLCCLPQENTTDLYFAEAEQSRAKRTLMVYLDKVVF